jgi:hypothetical protein
MTPADASGLTPKRRSGLTAQRYAATVIALRVGDHKSRVQELSALGSWHRLRDYASIISAFVLENPCTRVSQLFSTKSVARLAPFRTAWDAEPCAQTRDLAPDPPERLRGEVAFAARRARQIPTENHHCTAGIVVTDQRLADAETEPPVEPDRLGVRRSGDGAQLAATLPARLACELLVEQSG